MSVFNWYWSLNGYDALSVMVIGQDSQPCGLAVDRFIGEQDLVVRPLDPRLGKVPHISAAAVTEAGEPLLIVDIEDLFQTLGAWGECDNCIEDVNTDGIVNIDDVFEVLLNWGPCP